MHNDLEELIRVVRDMRPEMVREVLNFALFLHRKQDQEVSDDDGDSRYGTAGDGFDLLDRWDAIESPMTTRDVA